ncbi:WecB/TagA/CpsF family glycosyltransferase [Marinicrinis sediminis]|uniref:WecB/TagA/CpsF family glycosyltransferase n=1 Tax=Marinicrinis sediminis TaxID=1652465 RepID=A0ABW5RDE5_9BACL
MKSIQLFGVTFQNYTFSDLLAFMDKQIQAGDSAYVVTCNVDHLMKLRDNEAFQQAYEGAAVIVADGMPVIWASRLLGKPLRQKVSGSDLFNQLGSSIADRGYRLYFLGAGEHIASRAAAKLQETYPGIQIVGCYSPPPRFEYSQAETDKMIQYIRAAKPDIVLVGVGAPKQEIWMSRHFQAYGAPVSIGVGATFDFIAGHRRRAPLWMQRNGLEWLWRLLQEPRRLWRRYLVEDIGFIPMVWKEWRLKRKEEKKYGR